MVETVLVTGGAGFIGFHVARELHKRGKNVIIVDNFNDYYDVRLKRDRVEQLDESIKIYEGDISDIEFMRDIFQSHKIDKVCHLAAQAGVRYSIENPFLYQKSNSLGQVVLLELCKEFGIKHFIFASSSSVYGNNKKVPFSEEDSVDNPISLYAATKKSNELYAHVYHNLYGINCFGLRFFTVYGPWGRPDMAYFSFTKKIIAGKTIDVYNNGDLERDFTYINDIVEGVIKSIDICSGFEIINLGNNSPVRLMDFIKTLEKEIGKEANKNMIGMQKGDVEKTFADISKAERLLDFNPKTKIDEGLKNFIEWYKKYNKIN